MLFLVVLIYLAGCAQGQDRAHWHQLNQIGTNQRELNEKNKCEIEIFTRGSCIVNNSRLKPQVILSFEHKHNPSRQTWQNNYTANHGKMFDF